MTPLMRWLFFVHPIGQILKEVMKIFAVAYNYDAYNKAGESPLYMGKEPVVFMKADSALLKGGRPLFLPDELGRIDYEAELVVRICRLGKGIPERFAHRYYDAVTCGVDFTARDLQQRLSAEGLPWDISKSFDGAAAVGEWVPCDSLPTDGIPFRLDVNHTTVQVGHSADMCWSIDALIAYISRWFTLRTGDLIFTGTPSPTGPVHIDDHITGYIGDKKVLEFNVK